MASRARRPCRSTRSRTTPARGLNFYGGVLGLDTSSNVVPASGLHTQRNYADQLLFPDPELVPRHPLAARRRRASSASATGMTASRSAPRRAGSSPSSSSRRTSSATTSSSATNTSTTCSTRRRRSASTRASISSTRSQPVRAVPRHAGADAPRLRHRYHHPQLRICRLAIRDQLRAGPEHRRRPTRPSPSRTA